MPRSQRSRAPALTRERRRAAIPTLFAVFLVAFVAACGGDSRGEEGPQDLLIGGPTAAPTTGSAAQRPSASATPTFPPTPTRSPTIVSLAWLDGQPAMPPLPAFAPSAPDAGLSAAVGEALKDTPGKISIFVRNLQDGRSAATNENEVYYAASLFKLGILYEVYRQRDAGLIELDTLITLEQKYAEHNLGTMEDLGLVAGDFVTIGDAARAMTIASDTPTGVLLQDTVGCKLADETLASLGIGTTRFCNRELPATAADMAVLMTAVAGGAGVSEVSRNEMLSLLSQEYYRPYVIAVLTDQPGNWPAIAKISTAAWSYFEANPG